MAREWFGMPGYLGESFLPAGYQELSGFQQPGSQGIFDLRQLGLRGDRFQAPSPNLGGTPPFLQGLPGGAAGPPPPAGSATGQPAQAGAATPPLSPYAIQHQQSAQNLASKAANAVDGLGTRAWRSLIEQVAAEVGVDPDLIESVMEAESNGNPQAISQSGAIGLMQLMPATARGLGVNPYDARDNLRGGARYLKQMLGQYGGDVTMALAAYNAGPGQAANWRNLPETAAYVPKVQAAYNLRKQGQAGGYQATPTNPQVDAAVREAYKHIGTPYHFGGSQPGGFDCSGLVQYAYGRAGVTLPRTAQQQYDATERVPGTEARAGDLVFFQGTYDAGTYVTHVGIYLGNNKVLMAPSEGKTIDVYGLDTPYWQRHFAGFGRLRQRG